MKVTVLYVSRNVQRLGRLIQFMEGTESAELLWACVIPSGGQRPFYWSQKDLFSQQRVDVRTVSPGIITCNVSIVLQTSLNINGTIQ